MAVESRVTISLQEFVNDIRLSTRFTKKAVERMAREQLEDGAPLIIIVESTEYQIPVSSISEYFTPVEKSPTPFMPQEGAVPKPQEQQEDSPVLPDL